MSLVGLARRTAASSAGRKCNRLREMRQHGIIGPRNPSPLLRPLPQRTTLPMILRRREGTVALAVCVAVLAVTFVGCRRKEPPAPPVATPSLTLSHDKAPLGSPLDIHYKFVVAPDAHFAEDYRVMVHVVDADDELIFAFDHNPPTPTSQWKPGQTIEYTKTVFIPIFPYVGEASIQVGLHSTVNQKRLPLAGEDVGQRAYKVAR